MGHKMTYLWQKGSWPSFYWTHGNFINSLVRARHNQGRLLALKQNFVHSFEMVDVRQPLFADWFAPGLDEQRLLGWQASLFPTGFAGIRRVSVGAYRLKDFGKASFPSTKIGSEITNWLQWWNEPPEDLDPLLRAAIGSVWFLIISPFEAGNFVLAAALAEKALVETEGLSYRTYDLSLQFEENEERIKEIVKEITEGDGDLSNWISYFLEMMNVAITSALNVSEQKDLSEKLWKQLAAFDLNIRQKKILNYMIEENQQMTNRLYKDICKTSRESAKRDLTLLVKMGLLSTGDSKGRSVFYTLNLTGN
ncbi:MAG: hypothetical protein K0R29_2840 [Pseudobdellovibrio sp.]|jgi:Fic family protein|nr:hypothetical protein [Pseudobdellovibrio sp.]